MCGFLISEEKSHLDPHQVGEFLGYSVDLENGVFSVPQKKVNGLLKLLHDVRSQHTVSVSACAVARVTGTIISMGLALRPVARLFSRHLCTVQNNVVCLSEQVSLLHNGPTCTVVRSKFGLTILRSLWDNPCGIHPCVLMSFHIQMPAALGGLAMWCSL